LTDKVITILFWTTVECRTYYLQ